MNAVEVSQLTLQFQQQILFQDFNFSVEQGKWTTLLGSSGVGKSTLLRTIAGLEQQAIVKGNISFAHNTQLAWLAQQDALYPWLSIVDNVQLYAHLTGQKTAESKEKALYLLEQVKMQQHIHKQCYQLSGGQRQRIALARVLMQEANLILMDEPFSALDAVTRHQLQELSFQLLSDKTVLLITHDTQEAIRLSHYIYILKHQPATLSQRVVAPGQPLRALDHEQFGSLQQQLLAELIEGDV